MRLLESALQLLQLRRGESRPYAPLLALLRQDAVVTRVDLVREAGCNRDA